MPSRRCPCEVSKFTVYAKSKSRESVWKEAWRFRLFQKTKKQAADGAVKKTVKYQSAGFLVDTERRAHRDQTTRSVSRDESNNKSIGN